MIETFNDSVETASRILLKNGRITLKEIRRIPTVDSKPEEIAVAQNLIDNYDVDVVDDKWNGEIILHIRRPSSARRRPAPRNRRRASAVRSSA